MVLNVVLADHFLKPVWSPKLIHRYPQPYENVLFLFCFRGTLMGMIRENTMRLPRLSVRIWKLLDAHAEGHLAIGALAVIVLALLVAKYLADL